MWLTNECPQGGAKTETAPEGFADDLAVAFEAWCPNGSCYDEEAAHDHEEQDE